MTSLDVPELANSDFFDGGIAWPLLRSAATLLAGGERIDQIDLSRVRQIRPYEVAIVAAIARWSQLQNGSPSYRQPKDDQVREHLERLELPEIVSHQADNIIKPRATNLSIQVLEGRPDDSFGWDATELLARELGTDLPAGVHPNIAENIDEVVLNAVTHADSPIGCVVVGQAFPATGVVEVVVLDLGITILAHLRKRHADLADDASAIERALIDGVTGTIDRNRFGEPNSGAGLARLAEFLTATGGELAILSGSAVVCLNDQRERRIHPLHGPPFRGTLVNMSFRTAFES